MKRNMFFLLCFCVFFLLVPVMQSVVAEEKIVVDFYYSKSCGSCKTANMTMHIIEAEYEKNYSGLIIFNMKEVSNYTYNRERQARNLGYPSVIINNETSISKDNITQVYMENISYFKTTMRLLEASLLMFPSRSTMEMEQIRTKGSIYFEAQLP